MVLAIRSAGERGGSAWNAATSEVIARSLAPRGDRRVLGDVRENPEMLRRAASVRRVYLTRCWGLIAVQLPA
jgi:hypothetical protein